MDKSLKPDMAISDDELYHQYLSGDLSCGDQLMLRYGDMLAGYLKAFLHNEQDAEDVMIDSFAAILVNRPDIREGNFRAYLYKTAKNIANRLWRQRFRRNEFELDESISALDDSLQDEVWKKERRDILKKCLNRIAPQYREAIYLVYDLDLSYAQAAKVLGCSVKKVDNLLANGKKSMKKELEKEGLSYEDFL